MANDKGAADTQGKADARRELFDAMDAEISRLNSYDNVRKCFQKIYDLGEKAGYQRGRDDGARAMQGLLVERISGNSLAQYLIESARLPGEKE